MNNDAVNRATAWVATRQGDFLDAPLRGAAEAGLFRVGLPAPYGEGAFAAIGAVESVLIAESGLPGLGMTWAGRQLTARHFIAGFATPEQAQRWLAPASRGEAAFAVAISEPKVGAHPKLLTTQATRDGDTWRISGEKSFVTNGPEASHIVVFAIVREEQGRKRYGAFVVPRDAEGLTFKPMPELGALKPSQHCGLVLDNVAVPEADRLGPDGGAYEAMALTFRNVEDAAGAPGLHGSFQALVRQLAAATPPSETAGTWIGGMAGLVAVLGEGARAAAEAVDAGDGPRVQRLLVGLRVLAADLLSRARAHGDHGTQVTPAITRLFGDFDLMMSIARGPRAAQQAALGTRLIGTTTA
ncbi:acyl-CoA dehydrogenase family protein [Zavarzinia sp. CC-PAN008]|uniref:acyl-CoA dehydrogenase family protein n=1 Tax=Zavarzinia sp. CC-PAN008 TaxID=3243332 RepID=UPI003F748004